MARMCGAATCCAACTGAAHGSGARQHLILRPHKAENLAGDFFYQVVVGLLGCEECNVAFELGAHGFEAFDLKL